MKYFGLLFLFLLCFQSSFSQNVVIRDIGSQNEPSIMLDPNNPNRIVAGSNLNFSYFSLDGGVTWTTKAIKSDFGVWGDPTIVVDTMGHFYFFHLSNPPAGKGNWIDRIVCQKSTDSGATWSAGTFVGLNGTKGQDKQWSVVDRKTNTIYLTWTQFDKYNSGDPLDSSLIMFSKSTDGGDTWLTAKTISKFAGDCIDGDNAVGGAVPSVGANGEVYVAWSSPLGLAFNRSLDGGVTWMAEEMIIDSMPGGWDYKVPGIDRNNGFPITKCDLSGGPNHGTIYINWSDQLNGADNTDIWLTKSKDGGKTWAKRIKVNNDNAVKHQFCTWMDIDQTNGHLYFIFYDRRHYSDNQTDVYLANTTDGGNSFGNYKISESPFLPNDNIFFGDYANIVAHNGMVRPIWTRLDKGQLSIITDITPFDQLVSVDNSRVKLQSNQIVQYPNPVSNISYVSFKLHAPSIVNLELFDTQGKSIHTIIKNEIRDYGKYIIPIGISDLHLPCGTYFVRLTINGTLKTLKTVVIN